jgi:osmoprotectant transport system permease protein
MTEGRQNRISANRVLLLLLAVGVVATASLAFVSHARNRLVSGKPVGFIQAVQLAHAAPVALLAAGVLLLLAPFLFPARVGRWLSLLGGGATLGGLGWLAGAAAIGLALSGSPSARTSLGAGFWIAAVMALLAAGDAAQRLRLPLSLIWLTALLMLGPFVLLLGLGTLNQLSILKELATRHDVFMAALLRHVLLVVGALIPTVLLGIPLGVAAWRRDSVRRIAFPILNVVQTIPSIALFGLLIAPLSSLSDAIPLLPRLGISGVGIAPAIIALVLYSMLPVVRNTTEGLAGVPATVQEAARGMGLTRRQSFWRVEIPLALPVILAGLRITAVQAVGLAAVSALIGAGGLGAIMFDGLFANALDLVLLGALPVILLAVLVDLIFRVATGLTARWSA